MLLGSLILSALLTSGVSAQPARLVPFDVEQAFVEPNRPAVLRWRWEGEPGAATLDYVVRDYDDRIIQRGQARRAADGAVEVELTLPQGFCEIELPVGGQRFGLVALPKHAGPADPFFAIDSALSWLVRADDVRRGLVRVLARSGIGLSRERLGWGQVCPASEKFDWNAQRGYDTVRRLHAEAGVKVLEMWHDAPRWLGHFGKYPDDLAAAARTWQTVTDHWRSTWGALEVWNEPDISFGDFLPGDQYMSVVQAFAVTHRRQAAGVPLVGGVFATSSRVYLDACADNGLARLCDVVSFHTYDRATSMERLVARFRDWLGAHGRAAVPLWITESGRPWKRGPERPPADQDALSAMDVTMKAVEAKACGVAAYFTFVYPYYEENTNNFSLMDRRATPLRSMAAYARCAAVLCGLQYVGDLARDDRALVRARLFRKEGQTLAVLYTAHSDQTKHVRLNAEVERVEGIDGRKLALDSEGRVPVPNGLCYVWLRPAPGKSLPVVEGEALRLWRIAQTTPAPAVAPAPIVLRWQFEREQMSADATGYRVNESLAGQAPIAVRAFNLGERPAALSLRATVLADGKACLDLPAQTVQVAAGKSSDVRWTADLRPALAQSHILAVRVDAGAGAERPLPLVVRVLGNPTMENLLRRYPRRERLPIDDEGRWKPAVAGHGRMTLDKPADGVRRLSVQFTGADRWVYPQFHLPESVDLTKAEAIVLRARCEQRAVVRLFLWEGQRGVGYITPESVISADGQWHAAEVRFADLRLSTANAPDENDRLDLDQVRRISIGMNSDAAENVLEFSDVYVVGR